MNEDKFVQRIKEKLLHHRLEVPSSVWQGIDKHQQSLFYAHIRNRWYIAAAIIMPLIIASVVLLMIPQQHSPLPEPPLATSKTTENETDSLQHVADTVSITCTTIPHHTTIVAVTTSANKVECTHKASSHITPSEVDCTNNKREEEITHNNTDDTQHPGVDTNRPLISYCNCNNSCNNNTEDNIINSLPTAKNTSNWIAFEANTSRSQHHTIPFSLRCGETEIVLDHHMPLNVKALFEKRFKRWSIGTGLSYTYMSAGYDMTHNIRKGKQELHYVGIPLYAGYEFARINRFSFYVNLGGQIDINTVGKHIESPDSYAYTCIKETSFREDKPQFSLQTHVGAAYEIIPHFEIYVEPSFGYYFNNNTKVHSVWKDHPWNVGLSLGIRTGF